jgi:hypothetical protein
MINLTSEQWKQVDVQAKDLAKAYADGFSEEKFGKGEIFGTCGGWEQREYGGNYYWLEKELGDIIENLIIVELEEEEIGSFDARMIEGFHELVIDFESWLSDLLPSDWYVYYEDGDIWVARSWDDVDNIPEDLQHLVNA